jgi:hypothetical protein
MIPAEFAKQRAREATGGVALDNALTTMSDHLNVVILELSGNGYRSLIISKDAVLTAASLGRYPATFKNLALRSLLAYLELNGYKCSLGKSPMKEFGEDDVIEVHWNDT